MSQVTFNKTNLHFFDELKEKTNYYFNSNNLKRTGNSKLYIKSIILILAAITSYSMLLFFPLPVWCSLAFCVFLGALVAAIGFNIMHDGAHGSYSSKKWINEIMGYSFNLIGCNVFIWKNKHNVNHHSYTNIEGMDDDIDIEPWIRTNVNQKSYWFHRYQHIYWMLLYGFTYVLLVFVNDFIKYFSKKIGNTKLQKMNIKEHIIFWISKIAYISIFLIVPIFKLGLLEALIGYSIMAFTCGLIISVIFQLAHIVVDTEFPLIDKNSNKIKQEWVIHQIATTANFSTNNKMVFWFTGGLNFQLVHHIFPKICHVHYPQINELIKETCKQFNVKYIEYPSFWSALRSHVSHLRYTGRN